MKLILSALFIKYINITVRGLGKCTIVDCISELVIDFDLYNKAVHFFSKQFDSKYFN
jgi:hypothetical protein